MNSIGPGPRSCTQTEAPQTRAGRTRARRRQRIAGSIGGGDTMDLGAFRIAYEDGQVVIRRGRVEVWIIPSIADGRAVVDVMTDGSVVPLRLAAPDSGGDHGR